MQLHRLICFAGVRSTQNIEGDVNPEGIPNSGLYRPPRPATHGKIIFSRSYSSLHAFAIVPNKCREWQDLQP